MFREFTRWLSRLGILFGGALLYGACATAEPGEQDAPLGQVQLAQDTAISCVCINGQGEEDSIKCLDTCFRDGAAIGCGGKEESCATVCRYPVEMSEAAGAECEGALPAGDTYKGLCANSGVTPANRAGCCPGCLLQVDKLFRCGGPADPGACGRVGGTCSVCEDRVPGDCRVPVCKEGTCTTEEQPAPPRQPCNGLGGAGRCDVDGNCCTGCLTPANKCNVGTQAGACGEGGAACVNCSDGVVCNGAEKCDTGRCVAGAPLNCATGNACIMGSCAEPGGCEEEILEGEDCSDGNSCTVDDSCNANGSCAGTAITCNDNNECTTDSCSNGSCQYVPVENGTSCDDASSCTTDTVCQEGQCVASDMSQVTCHDETNPCVTSSCGDDGMSACSEVNLPDDTPCNDNDPCSIEDSCQNGVCTGGGSLDCDDNNPCTSDSCDPTSGCVRENASGECADGDLCTENDRCQDGVCAGDAVECEAINECHAEGECNDETGVCSVVLEPDGTECGEAGECEDGSCDGEMIPMGSGGSAGTAGTGGDASAGAAGESGDDAAGGSGGTSAGGVAGVGGGAGEASVDVGGAGGGGGTYGGKAYVRDPQGCDCRAAPGSDLPLRHSSLGVLGLGLVVGMRLRRRRRLQLG